MLILTIRSDNPEAEIGLYNDNQQLVYEKWSAHRELAETLHAKIRDMLAAQHQALEDLEGIVVYKGPGSFTGLRIGLTVANAFAASLHIPIYATEDPTWLESGIAALQKGEDQIIAIPEYGALPNITAQRK